MVEEGPSAPTTRSARTEPVAEGSEVDVQWTSTPSGVSSTDVTVRLWKWAAVPCVGSLGGTSQYGVGVPS